MKVRTLSLIAAAACIGGLSASAQASVYFEENFNNLSGALTNGQTSTGGTWSVTTDTNTNVEVIADPTGSGRGNVLHLHDSTTTGTLSAIAVPTNAISGAALMKFDFYLPRLGSYNGTALFIQNSTNSRRTYNLITLPSGSSDGTYKDYDHDNAATTISSTLKPSTWYTATLTLPDPAGTTPSTLHITVRNDANTVLGDGDAPMVASMANQQYGKFQFAPASTSSLADLYIDNVRITTVPEPVSLGLLGMGGLLLLRRRRGK